MNKKNMAKLGVSLGLVGALGVGATLAMLSDKTDDVTNTFALSQNGIGIRMDEAKWNGTGRTTQNNYTGLVAGQTVDKDPTVYISAKSVNANVFVKVTNDNAGNLTYNNINIYDQESNPNGAWEDITNQLDDKYKQPGVKYYVYRGNTENSSAEKDTGDDYYVVPTDEDNETQLTPVFTKVTVVDFTSNNKPSSLNNIVVRAAAVQADSVTDEAALEQALDLLNQSN